jgi:hypothetical protein
MDSSVTNELVNVVIIASIPWIGKLVRVLIIKGIDWIDSKIDTEWDGRVLEEAEYEVLLIHENTVKRLKIAAMDGVITNDELKKALFDAKQDAIEALKKRLVSIGAPIRLQAHENLDRVIEVALTRLKARFGDYMLANAQALEEPDSLPIRGGQAGEPLPAR